MTDITGNQSRSVLERVIRERLYTGAVLLAVASFTFFDLLEDRLEGAAWEHIVAEAVVMAVTAFLGIYFFRRVHFPLERRARALNVQLADAEQSATKLREESELLLKGLAASITRQFEAWRLSQAEKDIAFFLLKGLSHKEIAQLRDTSEHTVRQQAAGIYQKSGLTGRTELSAFFLEDLLTGVSAIEVQGSGLEGAVRKRASL